MKKVFTVLCLLFGFNALCQSTYFVNDNASGASNGTSWTDAFTKLQDALAAAGSGDQIWVAEGTYYPDEGAGLTNDNRSHSFFLKNGVAIYGGFAGTETQLSERNVTAHVTTLSGDIDQNDNAAGGSNANNSLHVVQSSSVSNTAVLDGFTIGWGNADLFPDNFGGGMYNIVSAPSVVNCNFLGNAAGLSGGGIYNASASPSFVNCSFSDNTAFNKGGGMANNDASPTLTNCSFTGNKANTGGALHNESSSSPSLVNCVFSENAASNGGGVANGSSSPNLVNCSFSKNAADFNGGGIYNFYSSSATLVNCSFSENSAGNSDGAGGLYSELSSTANFTNCILWGNINGEIINGLRSDATVSYSIVQGNYTGTGNLDQDPLFVDAANGDLHLQAGSPAIDAGLNSANTTSVDLDGNPRVVNSTIDMGAYEFQGSPFVITSVTATPSTLWPPNHKMKEVQVDVATSGGNGNTNCQITAVTSNEPQSGGGTDDLTSDWQIVGADKVLLRAERNGKGNGRIYTITVTCTGADGSSDSKTVQVKVPHDQGHEVITSIDQNERNAKAEATFEAGVSLRATPNPFSSQATISFSVPQSGFTTLDLIDATGAVMKHLYAAQAEKGRIYTQTLASQQLKGGVYILRLAMDKYVQTYRLVLVQ